MKRYISAGSWFAFDYPAKWHEFQDEEDGSFLFYNPDVWTGNFRISASLDISPEYARATMRDELEDYAGARRIDIGGREFIYSTETIQEEGEWYTTHYWVTGERYMAIFATFTTPKGGDITEAVNLLETLRLLNPRRPDSHEVIPVRLLEVALINEAYETVLKEVKNQLKKDFSSATIEASLGHLDRLWTEGKLKPTPATWERLGRVLGCFLIDELDGVEWVTLIDGQREEPALLFTAMTGSPSPALPLADAAPHLIDPVHYLAERMGGGKGYTIAKVYEELKRVGE